MMTSGQSPASGAHSLRIVHIITKGRPMGGAQIDTYLNVRHQHMKDDVHIITGNDGPLNRSCEELGIPTRVIRLKNTLLDPIGDAIALLRLTRLLRAMRPDIVHTHSSKAGVVGRLAARLAGPSAVVHTLHVLPYHDRQPAPLRLLLIQIERLCSPLTDMFVAVADTLKDDFIANEICRAEHIRTVGSGIDLDAFPSEPGTVRRETRAALGIPLDSPVVIAVANLEPRKRLDLLVESIGRMAGREPRVVCLIAGVGEMQSALEQQIQQRGLEETVRLLGRRDDVPALLAASDIFVQTSQLEGLSRSVLEAMYSGLPVVATDVNATREVVRDGETGLLFAPGDVQGLTERLLALFNDPDLRSQLGSSARHVVGELWSLEATGSALDRVYELALERRKVRQSEERGGEGLRSG